MLWSILICTLEERARFFDRIYNKLNDSIAKHGLEGKIEVIYFKDRGENAIGKKRNDLINRSNAEYVCFVDDDDDVSDEYIPLVWEALMHKPDCIGITGVITWNGANPKIFIHSLKYDRYFESGGIYYRPPNHLNPVRRSIAQEFIFPEKNFGEDTDWAMQLCRSGALKVERFIDRPLYYYLFVPNKKY